VHQPIQNGIGQGRIDDKLMPFVHRHRAVIQQLQHVAPLLGGKRHKPPVEDQQIGLGVAVHQFREEVFQQVWQAQVAHSVAVVPTPLESP